MPLVLERPAEVFARCEEARRAGARVGFVPTMGALHEGHLSLIEAARARGATFSVLSIFVNPLQFGPREDLDRYPRTFDADLILAERLGVEVVYAPAAPRMYPDGFCTQVEVGGLSEHFEGRFRPGHFRGVATVVTKLWNAVGACVSVFGRKDYQQWRILERLALDLDLPVEVVGAPIMREPDGLAMSSRNRYLAAEDRGRALSIVEGLRAAHDAFAAGERDAAALAALARAPVERAFDRIDYVACADPESLAPVSGACSRVTVLVAAHLGGTRLIDNLELGHDPRP